MPVINVQPVTMSNQDRVTYYRNTVGTTVTTYTFLTRQEKVKLHNKGNKDIQYTIGSRTGTLERSEMVIVEELVSSITLQSTQGTQHFEIWADEEGPIKPSTEILEDVTAQLAQTQQQNFYQSLVNSKTQRAMMTILDDDTRNELYDVIFPVLKELNVPITSAAITGRIESGDQYTVTKPEYKEMLKSGLVEFISHTVNHNDLTTLTLDEVENELKGSREWLLSNGGNPDYFVYPFNGQNDDIRNLTRKYYKGAFSTDGNLNLPPLRTYLISRVDFESTFDQQKAWIDQAIQGSSWVIFNTHSSYPSFTAQGLRDLINYAISVGIEIVTIGEGMKHFGNLLDVGDMNSDFENYAVIDAEGKMHGKLSTYKYVDRGTIISTTPITEFDRMCSTICHFTGSAATSAGFPGAGVLLTNRVLGDDYSYQEYRMYHSHDMYYRYWDSSKSAWGSFILFNENTTRILTLDEKPITTPATDYEYGKLSVMRITTGLPAGYSQGTLLTDRRGGHNLYIHQTLEISQSHDVLRRYWIHTSNTWSGWKKYQMVDVV